MLRFGGTCLLVSTSHGLSLECFVPNPFICHATPVGCEILFTDATRIVHETERLQIWEACMTGYELPPCAADKFESLLKHLQKQLKKHFRAFYHQPFDCRSLNFVGTLVSRDSDWSFVFAKFRFASSVLH